MMISWFVGIWSDTIMALAGTF